MSVREWTPAQRLMVELRKAIGTARRAGRSTEFVALSDELEVPQDLSLAPDEVLVAVVRNRDGRRFCFTAASVYIETEGGFQQLRYDAVTERHWITR